ncbi:MAG: hypothetical protein A3F16_02865 [Deltaproteobacteria bacterium RIFCSPHIGHO2_12_FULL_43_9]|nr:MAG: hypothetical protein A3F16_02865 [Deltaproteobacteria bacterium RIFCSPHIGHO2_12_FULL_43_9]
MFETIDEINIAYEEDGKLLTKQLDKSILSRGGWTTIMFLYQELDKTTNTYKTPKISIRRYQKRGGTFRQQSKFTISNKKQGEKICEVLKEWFDKISDESANEQEE